MAVGFCVLKLRLETVQAEAAQAVGLPPIVTSSRQRSASPDPRDGRDKSSGSGGSGGGRARGLGAARSNLSGGSSDDWWRRCLLLPSKASCRAVLLLRLEFSLLELRQLCAGRLSEAVHIQFLSCWLLPALISSGHPSLTRHSVLCSLLEPSGASGNIRGASPPSWDKDFDARWYRCACYTSLSL